MGRVDDLVAVRRELPQGAVQVPLGLGAEVELGLLDQQQEAFQPTRAAVLQRIDQREGPSARARPAAADRSPEDLDDLIRALGRSTRAGQDRPRASFGGQEEDAGRAVLLDHDLVRRVPLERCPAAARELDADRDASSTVLGHVSRSDRSSGRIQGGADRRQ